MKRFIKGAIATFVVALVACLSFVFNNASAVTYTTPAIEFKGAQIRTVDDGYQGLRFVFQVTTLPDANASDVTYGVVVYDRTAGGVLSKNSALWEAYISNNPEEIIDGVYKFSVSSLSTYMGYENSFALTLYGYDVTQYNHEIQVRGYCRFTPYDTTTSLLAMSSDVQSRSIAEIAEKVYDTDSEMRENTFVSSIVEYARANYTVSTVEDGAVTYSNNGYSYTVDLPEINAGNGFYPSGYQAPTCAVDGYNDYSNDIYGTVRVAIPKLGHTYETVAEIPSTCQELGYDEHLHCTTCGKYFAKTAGEYSTAGKDDEESFKKNTYDNHTFVDGRCTECSCPNLIYVESGNTYNVQIKDYTGNSEVIIPSTYRGKAITTIARPSDFGDASVIMSLTIPDSVTRIEVNALNSMTCGLDYLYVPDCVLGDALNGVYSYDVLSIELATVDTAVSYIFNSKMSTNRIQSIKYNYGKELYAVTFDNCAFVDLTSITLPDELETIENRAFYEVNLCETLTLPNNVKTISASAFEGASKLKTLNCPASLETIDMFAFRNCQYLKTITGLDNVTSIGQEAFKNSKITELIAPKATLGISALSGCSINTLECVWNESEPLGCCFQTSPGTLVRQQGSTSYYISTALENVTIHGCSSIPSHFLEDAISLKTATFVDPVTSIGDNAFKNSKNTSKVYLPGCEGNVTIGANVTSSANQLVFAIDHNEVDNYCCSNCGEYLFDDTNYTFAFQGRTEAGVKTEVENDIAFYSVSVVNNTDTTIYVPGVYNGKPVKIVTSIIGANIETINIASNIDIISFNAIGCILTNLTPGDTLTISFENGDNNYVETMYWAPQDKSISITGSLILYRSDEAKYTTGYYMIVALHDAEDTDHSEFDTMYGEIFEALGSELNLINE